MFNKRGQSTLEYAIIIAVVIGGLMVMQHYVKRGYSGKLKSSADEMGQQYDPATFSGTVQLQQSANVRQVVAAGVTTTTQNTDQTSGRTGSENQGAWDPSTNMYGQ